MAEIIDLDFYRKFRIILPVRSLTKNNHKSTMVSRTVSKRYRRRQKIDLEEKIENKE